MEKDPINDHVEAIDQANKEVGSTVGKYLFSLAAISLAWMMISPFLLGSFIPDLSPIFNVVAGIKLRNRNNRWRRLTIGVYSFTLLLAFLMIVFTVVTPGENLTFHFGVSVRNPPKMAVILVSLALSIFCLYPVVALLSRNAKKQFGE